MIANATPQPPSLDQPIEFRKKDGSLSKRRSHKGNIPLLPQTKLCPRCPAKFTRTTHLTRHLKTHTNERLHHCNTCNSQFTRSDLLGRHKRTCNDSSNRAQRKSCISCTDSKIKCDRQYPCEKCNSKGKECSFVRPAKSTQSSRLSNYLPQGMAITPYPDAFSPSSSTAFARTSESSHSFSTYPTFRILEPEDTMPTKYLSTPPDHNYSSTVTNDFKSIPPIAARLKLDSSTVGLYSSAASDTVNDVNVSLPVRGHLSSRCSDDMFGSFFSNIFSPPSFRTAMGTDHLPSAGTIDLRSVVLEECPLTRSVEAQRVIAFEEARRRFKSQLRHSILPHDPSLRPIANNHFPSSDRMLGNDPLPAELQNYLYLFFSEFSLQMPIVHSPTFNAVGKPRVLLSAMQACGALFVKTRNATAFITQTLAAAREALVREFAKDPTESADQVHLVLAVVLLQAIGLFHQKPDQRASSSIYHGMLVMMIRRAGLISKNASWYPEELMESSIDKLWQEWALHEMTKRALWLSYLHDCCHCIYFALPPSYHLTEIELNLPCEDNLWKAGTSAEWFMALQTTSTYGSPRSRLLGTRMLGALASIVQTQLLAEPIPLNSFAHFVLIHSILRHLFSVCVESRLPKTATRAGDSNEEINQQIVRLQYALHNWLQSWVNSPEAPQVVPNEEPLFIHHALPFYWLGQVSLLAYQEGLPPFERNSSNNMRVEVRFRLVKQWLRHIRGFLQQTDEVPTLFWDELMKIRLQTWQLEVESDIAEDQEGLLGFFPGS